MSAIAVVAQQLERAGLRLATRGPKLVLKPKSRLTPELLDLARRHRDELLAFQRAREIATWCRDNGVDPAIGAEIGRIEDEALARGWPAEHLWGAKFWPGDKRGLATVMDPDDQIVGVTADAIAILKFKRDIQRFYRRDS